MYNIHSALATVNIVLLGYLNHRIDRKKPAVIVLYIAIILINCFKKIIFGFCCRRGAISMSCSTFGFGNGPILLDDVDCLGTETDIGVCKHRGWTIHNCNHVEDVAVRCSPPEGKNHSS